MRWPGRGQPSFGLVIRPAAGRVFCLLRTCSRYVCMCIHCIDRMQTAICNVVSVLIVDRWAAIELWPRDPARCHITTLHDAKLVGHLPLVSRAGSLWSIHPFQNPRLQAGVLLASDAPSESHIGFGISTVLAPPNDQKSVASTFMWTVASRRTFSIADSRYCTYQSTAMALSRSCPAPGTNSTLRTRCGAACGIDMPSSLSFWSTRSRRPLWHLHGPGCLGRPHLHTYK